MTAPPRDKDDNTRRFGTGPRAIAEISARLTRRAFGRHGFAEASLIADWPLITGQDGDKANVKAILAGEQAMTVWKDTRKLGERVFQMIQQINTGATVEVNDTKSYNNGVKVVPSYLLDPEVVTKDLVQSKLIDSGFLKASDVGL